MKIENKFATLAILFMVFVWGLSFINIRVAVAVVPPMTLGLLRFILASVILALMVFLKKENLKIEKKDYIYFFIAGFVGITVYFFFENNGVKYTSASSASLIIATVPVFSVIAEAIFYKTKVTFKTIISLILSVTGVALIVGFDIKELLASGYFKGYTMMFFAVISWIIYMLASKPLFDRYSQLSILFYQTLIGTVCFIPFSIYEKFDYSLLNTEVVIHIAILGIFASAIGFYLYLYALDKMGITKSSMYLNLVPAVTVIIGAFYLKEILLPVQILGGIFVILSVYIINIKDKNSTMKLCEDLK